MKKIENIKGKEKINKEIYIYTKLINTKSHMR